MSISTITSKTIGASTERVDLKRYGDGAISYTPKLVVNGTTANGSPTITSVASTNGVIAGMPISGTGIPAGATVVSVVEDTSITISDNCTADGTVAITVDKSKRAAGSIRTQPGECTPEFISGLFAALNAVN
jgi:hypothetical protein